MRNRISLVIVCMLCTLSGFASKYVYDTVPGDPYKAKIYTLPNGLKLYMSVNKDRPRIQTNIAVRVGGKNDPAETTGLAHYFEHLMFKGTPVFGTTDYAAEKPMLDQIEQLFEVYRVTTDSAARAGIYHVIDSISYEASKLAIPNEYDKLMSAIGASGTNAYTSTDETCYVEEIPSNQIENWAKIQSIRFKEPVLRGFHTELETIYEEKNMSLTDDTGKSFEKIMSLLFPHHPYGTQTILGTQEHLKNPSITNVKNYHKKWYVPNNMAIVMSGDFDPDYVVDVVTRYFGDMKPNDNLEYLTVVPEEPITTPKEGTVTGLESEMVILGWWAPAARHEDADVIDMYDRVLSNGKTGLIDLDINQQQKMLSAGSFFYELPDQSLYLMMGMPNEGQSLEEVRDLLLDEARKMREGDFDENILPAIINNFKKDLQVGIEENSNRVDAMVEAFISGVDWSDAVKSIDRQEHITKADIVAVANKYFGPENYAVVYKRQGKDDTISKIEKPALTPIATNRDVASDFLVSIQEAEVEPIAPVFPDYKKDLEFLTAKNDVQVLYKHNNTNDVFSLIYVFDTGSKGSLPLSYAPGYMDLIGTKDKSPEEIKKEFYDLACTFSVSSSDDRSYIALSGLAENMPQAMAFLEDFLANAEADKDAWEKYVGRLLKSRADSKTDQRSSFGALAGYAMYGPDFVAYNYSNDELSALDPNELVDAVKNLRNYNQRIIYYGPATQAEVLTEIADKHYMPTTFTPYPESRKFPPLATDETVVYLAPYDSNQIYMYMISNNGEMFDRESEPMRKVYNQYFDGDMSSIVFQEMRESRSLAYSASAYYNGTSRLDRPYIYTAFIATQNDKMMDAIKAFDDIINNMPESPNAFRLAKDGFEANLRTARTIKDDVAWSYIAANDLGYTESPSKLLYEKLPSISLDDVVEYQKKHVKGRKYSYCILGRIEDLDIDALKKLGKVVVLTPEQTFGY